MKTVIGTAEVHERGSEVLGQTQRGGAGATITKQIIVFDVDGQTVQLKTADLFPVRTGDVVGAAGNIKNGVMNARAAVNVNRSVTAKSYWSHVGGKPVQAFITVVVATLFIITIPVAIVIALIYFMDTGAANKAHRLVKRAIKRAKL
ncbi:MAG: hypothetical protein AAGB02_01465 [Pseudomonadota bacterium]